MKLKNKKTGEIIDIDLKSIKYPDTPQGIPEYKLHHSLAELNEEREDYEELTTYYYISDFGAILEGNVGKFVEDEIARKEIGNYFSSREEAKLAVRKLKAWKRLKDKGFKFDNWNGTEVGSNISYISENYYEGWVNDMNLLFGGKE